MADTLHVVIPFYNAAATMERTVRSLRCLDSPGNNPVNVIGIDDGSTDSSAVLFEKESAGLKGIQAVCLRKSNGGSGSARNHGLRTFADGWVLFLDADDELACDPRPFLGTAPNATAHLFASRFCRDGRTVSTMIPRVPAAGRFPAGFTSRNPFLTTMVVFRRDVIETLFDESLTYLEDWHFWAVNKSIFARCSAHKDVCLGRVHLGERNKTGNVRKHGQYRALAAERIASFWKDKLRRTDRNNLAIQRAIGHAMMGEPCGWSSFERLPCSPSLYAKLMIYAFLFPICRSLWPYR